MAAAATLAARDIPVTVHEASRTLGGRARRVTVDGKDLDNGQHVLIGAYTGTLAIMRLVGADPDALLDRRRLELRYADGFHLRAARAPNPLDLLFGLLGCKGVSLRDALRAALFVAALRARDFRVEPDRPVARWLEESGQAGALRRYVWEPLCVSALNTPASLASARVFANVLRDTLTGTRGNSDLLLPRAHLGRLLPEPAGEFIRARGGDVRLGSAVRSIGCAPEHFRLDDRAERYSHVIIACAPQHVASLLPPEPGFTTLRASVERLRYEAITTCYLQYAETTSLTSPMLGLAGGRVQWLFDRGKLGGPPGLLAAVISASGDQASQEPGGLAAAIEAELAAALSVPPAAQWSRIITEKRATFRCEPSLQRPDGSTPLARLRLAGDYVGNDYPGTLESAVRSGVAAAEAIVRETALG